MMSTSCFLFNQMLLNLSPRTFQPTCIYTLYNIYYKHYKIN